MFDIRFYESCVNVSCHSYTDNVLLNLYSYLNRGLGFSCTTITCQCGDKCNAAVQVSLAPNVSSLTITHVEDGSSEGSGMFRCFDDSGKDRMLL